MNHFKTLFKYEMKKQFPMFSKAGNKNIIGSVFSLLLTVAVAAATVYFLSVLTQNYVNIGSAVYKVDRAYRFATIFYLFSIVLMTILCVEKMRKSFVDKSDKNVFLRMPIKHNVLFLTRLLVLLLTILITSALLVFPISIIINNAVKMGGMFWLNTVINFLLLPTISLLIASLLLLPYIKILDFLKNKFWLTFIVLSVLLVSLFAFYAVFLNVVQQYLQTGMIKFFFNEEFSNILKTVTKYSYPANCFAGILLGKNLVYSYLIVGAVAVVGMAVTVALTQIMYKHTLYRNEAKTMIYKRKGIYVANKPILALVKKEFIMVFRQPEMMFSFFVIAIAMPFMVYACYSLFETLILNMLGISVELGLALTIVLIFSVLTNTFCSTNITREGASLIKQKALPIKAEKLIGAKILLCSIVSVAAVLVSVALLVVFAGINLANALIIFILGALFSIAQILIATKMDLSHYRHSNSKTQNEHQASKTIAIIVLLGLAVATIVGVSAIFVQLFTEGMLGFRIPMELANAIPITIVLVYFGLALVYYKNRIQHKLDDLTA